jgi:hypothetical protein
MKVISYTSSLPAKQLASGKANQKLDTLLFFADGVNSVGDQCVVSNQLIWEPADVAVILGWVHEHGKQAPHLAFRQQILNQQKAINGRTIIADSNLFLYKDTTNPGYWLRYSYDGIFPNTGEYCDSNPDPSRWEKLSKELNISLQPWRTAGGHILLCLQRNGGWSMGGADPVAWAMSTIKTIRQYTNRTIIVRGHPGDKGSTQQVQDIVQRCTARHIKRVHSSAGSASLISDLTNCWAMVNHNSSPAVAAAIEGIPVFVTDPERSQAREVANIDLSQIENPVMFDRQKWVERISQCHWSHHEVKIGQCWQHMKQWAKK